MGSLFHGTIGTDQKGAKGPMERVLWKSNAKEKRETWKRLGFFFPLHFSQSLEFAEKSFLILTALLFLGQFVLDLSLAYLTILCNTFSNKWIMLIEL